MAGRGDDFKHRTAKIDLVTGKPPMRDWHGRPCHVLEGATIEMFRRTKEAVLPNTSAQYWQVGHGNFSKTMKIAGVIEMEMRRHGGERQGRQTSHDRCDITDAWAGVEKQGPFPAADKIVPVDLMIFRLADREYALCNYLDRIPVVVPAHSSGKHQVRSAL